MREQHRAFDRERRSELSEHHRKEACKSALPRLAMIEKRIRNGVGSFPVYDVGGGFYTPRVVRGECYMFQRRDPTAREPFIGQNQLSSWQGLSPSRKNYLALWGLRRRYGRSSLRARNQSPPSGSRTSTATSAHPVL